MYKQRLIDSSRRQGERDLLDPETGELESTSNYRNVLVKDYLKRKEPFTVINLRDIESLVSSNLTLTQLRVLLACMRYSGSDNEVRVNGKDIATMLKIGMPHVSKSKATLLQLGFLIKRPNEFNKLALYVSSHVCWGGYFGDLAKRQSEELSERMNVESVDLDLWLQDTSPRCVLPPRGVASSGNTQSANFVAPKKQKKAQ